MSVCAGFFAPIASGLVYSLLIPTKRTAVERERARPKSTAQKYLTNRFPSAQFCSKRLFHYFAFAGSYREKVVLQTFCLIVSFKKLTRKRTICGRFFVYVFTLKVFGLLEDYKSWIKLVSFN